MSKSLRSLSIDHIDIDSKSEKSRFGEILASINNLTKLKIPYKSIPYKFLGKMKKLERLEITDVDRNSNL